MSHAPAAEERSAGCPDERTLTDFSYGKLPEQFAETIADHLGHCVCCQTALAKLDSSIDPLLAAVRASEQGEFSFDADCHSTVQRVASLIDDPIELAAARHSTEIEFANRELIRLGGYQMLGRIGQGGMGAVFQARHIHLDKIVAIKVLAPSRVRDEQAVARFRREMRVLARLEHPNIVSARDAGEIEGVHYLVMDYVDGIDLATLVRQKGPLPVAEACELIRQAACGLQHAHEQGLIHRDIKPSNLILSKNNQVKLLDLGLALLHADPADEELTSVSSPLGTFDYMAPEQTGDSHQVDIRADLYSLGCTLHRLLTGRAPFAGPAFDTPEKKLLAHVAAPIPSLQKIRADVPSRLDAVVRRLLAKSPAQRYATPAQLVDALAPFAAGYDFARLAQTSTPLPQLPSESQPHRSRKWMLGATGVGLVMLLVATFALIRGREGQVPLNSASSVQRAIPPRAETVLEATAVMGAEESPRRQAAERILALGGSMSLNDGDASSGLVDDASQLPSGPFSVKKVVLAHSEHLANTDLSELPMLGNIEHLDLSYTLVSDLGLENLRELTTLAGLSLNRTRVTDAGLSYLKALGGLRRLHLSGTAITDAGLVNLVGLEHLEVLELNGTQLSDPGLTVIGEFRNLVELRIYDTRVTDAGLKQLRGLTRLQVLLLDHDSITDLGTEYLMPLQALQTLSLRHTLVSDVGLDLLERQPNLQSLDLTGTRVTTEGIEHFRRARPECEVELTEVP